MSSFEQKFVQHLPPEFYGDRYMTPSKATIKARLLLMIAQDELPTNCNEMDIKALMVPHAGLNYSGLCAASAYASLLGNGKRIKKIKNVVIMSTRHSGKPGILVPNISYFQYANHKFKINSQFYTEFNTIKGITMRNDEEFLNEHSLEIQMPFIWSLFVGRNIKYIPMLVGELTIEQLNKISDLLNKLNVEDTLWIINTDLMHVNGTYGYEIGTKLTRKLIEKESQIVKYIIKPDEYSPYAILSKNNKNTYTICGVHVLILWTAIAKDMDLIGKISSYYTSLHMTHTTMLTKPPDALSQKFDINQMFYRFKDERIRDGSVSYLGMVYIEKCVSNQYPLKSKLTRYEKYALCDYAARITEHLIRVKPKDKTIEASKTPLPFISGSYTQNFGCFVTFKSNGKLRGCIGTILYNNKDGEDSDEKLLSTINKYTVEAGFNDSRNGLTANNPLTLEEFMNDLKIYINILSVPKLISERDKPNTKALSKWKIGKEGILLYDKKYKNQSVFLPSVPIDMQWTKEETMRQLCIKGNFKSEEAWKYKYVDIYVIPGYEFSSRSY